MSDPERWAKMETPELLREVSVAGRFKISTPRGSTHELVENGTTLAFRLRAECEPLYLKRYDLPDGFSSTQSALEAEANRFLKEGIRSVREITGFNIDRGEVNGASYAQLVAIISESHWWVARFVAKPGSKSYFLLHCHGDKDYLILAIAMFCEFYILE